jgi:hypothetical protein
MQPKSRVYLPRRFDKEMDGAVTADISYNVGGGSHLFIYLGAASGGATSLYNRYEVVGPTIGLPNGFAANYLDAG